MLKPRNDLEIEIEYIKQDIYNERRITNYVDKLFKRLGGYFTLGKLTGILNGRFPLIQLSEEDLFQLSRVMSKEYPQLNITDWFLDSEIREWINKEIPHYTDNSIITLRHVMYNQNTQKPEYLCYIKYKDLAELVNSGKLEYDTNLQRSPKLITKMGKTIEIPTVNRESVQEISNKMQHGEFMANQITLNILRENNIIHNYSDGTLTIDTSLGRCLIIDGFHRITALTRAMRQAPHLDGVLILNIKNLDAEEVRAFIYQESLANAHNQATVNKFNLNDKLTIFTNKLNSYMSGSSNFFYHKIKTPISPTGELMNEDLFREGLAISKLDTIINKDETNLIEFNYYFVDFFNYIDLVLDRSKDEYLKSLLKEPTFIIGCFILCYGFYNTSELNKLKKLPEVLNKYKSDFTLVYKLPFTKSSRQQIYKEYKQILKEVL